MARRDRPSRLAAAVALCALATFGALDSARARTRARRSAAGQGAADAVSEALSRARTKVRRLQRLLAARGAQPHRVTRELRLSRLLLDVALLEPPKSQARRRALLGAASRLRALLVRGPSRSLGAHGGAARLLLARVEARLSHHARVRELAAVLARRYPSLACEARLLEGDAFAAQSKAAAAARSFARAASSCRGERQRLARYKLAWAEIRRRRLGPGSRELERLLSQPLPALFRGRVLRDLAATWMARRAPRGAASLLIRHGGRELGFELVEMVARSLLARQRVAAARALCERALTLAPPRARKLSLWRIRLRALSSPAKGARGGDAALLHAVGELAGGALEGALAEDAATALLSRARQHLARGRAARAKAGEALLTRVITGFAESAAANRARALLSRRHIAAERWEQAATLLGAALQRARGDARRELAYRQLAVTERALAGARGTRAQALGRRFEASARRYLKIAAASSTARSGSRARAVRRALAARLLARGASSSALDLLLPALGALAPERVAAQRRGAAKTARRVERSTLRLALRAAAALERFELAARLAEALYERCRARVRDGEPGARTSHSAPRRCERRRRRVLALWLAAAERSAPAGAEDAAKLARSARRFAHSGAERARVLRLEWQLWARAGKLARARALAQKLAAVAPSRKLRRIAALAAARLSSASLDFTSAARHYESAAQLAPGARRQLELMLDALRARALAAGGPRAAAERSATRFAASIALLVGRAELSRSAREHLELRLGVLWARIDARAAARYARRRGATVAKVRCVTSRVRRASGGRIACVRATRRHAARLLLVAARAAEPRRKRALAQQARALAGPLRRRGRIDDLAAGARVIELSAKTASRGRRSRRALRALAAEATAIVLLQHPRWSAQAATLLIDMYRELARRAEGARDEPRPRGHDAPGDGAMAWRRRARAVGQALARMARADAALNRHTLRAALGLLSGSRELSELASSMPVPADGLTKALLGALARGRYAEVSAASRAALGVVGERAALRCALARAELSAGHPRQALAELQQAMRSSGAAAACARRGAAAIALGRGDAEGARRLLRAAAMAKTR